ncbi:hypothetical protein [Demequina sp.]|uniref:hypothetical protein n=1 Tax=Demequina sp. TaxID=2050685 RepID=UPI003D09A043
MSIFKFDGDNPFDGIHPDAGVLGGAFNTKAGVILAAVWGVAFLIVAVMWIIALVKYGTASREGQAHGVVEATSGIKRVIGATIGLALAGVLFGAIVRLAS